jgi:hypothetical protein
MAKSLRQAAKSFNNTRWDEPIKDDLFAIPQKATRTRLYDHLATVRQHFVEFYSEKKKGNTGFYELCLNWDPVQDKEVEGGCPMCDAGMKPTEHHYAYLIVRQKNAKPGTPITVHPVRLTGKLAGGIVKLSEIVYPDPDSLPEGWDGEDAPDAIDQKFGFDVFLRKEEVNGKTDYIASHSDKSALTKAERAAFEEYISNGHDVAKLAKAGLRPRAEISQKLVQLKVIKGAVASAAKNKRYEDLDQDQVPGEGEGDGGEDPASPAPAKTNKVQAKPGKAKPEAEEEDAEPAPRAKPQQARKLPWDEGEEGEEHERSFATPEEDDAPAEEAADEE